MALPIEILDAHARPATLVEALPDGAVRCLACAHRCLIRPGRRGICRVRFNREGALYMPWEYASGLQVDPVEKKPFNHFLPGARALTFGMLGCNFHCAFCQNWYTSQTLRNPAAAGSVRHLEPVSAEQLSAAALRTGSQIIVSSYNEPFITAEWAAAIFRSAREHGLHTGMVSNGYGTPEALDLLQPHLDALKIDLKSMRQATYRQMGGVLEHVLNTIREAVERKIWVEVVTLVIPGMNDSPEELWEAARFLAALNPDLPWHVTAFHPDYNMPDTPPTPPETLRVALEVGEEAGLRYVYSGNLPGRVRSSEDTLCPTCRTLLIRRRGFQVLDNNLSPAGTCPACGTALPGIWR